MQEHPEMFENEVRMYVYEELVDGERYLTSIINSTHENVKYGHHKTCTFFFSTFAKNKIYLFI